jgi:nucleoside-diphosphate-sugar epimerase
MNRLALTHVANCADCFVTATESFKAIGQTLNVTDGDAPRNWSYMGRYLRDSRTRGVRIFLPYRLGKLAGHIATACSRLLFGRDGKLPGILVPLKYEARFIPLNVDRSRLRDVLGWHPPLSFEQAWQRSFDPGGGPRAKARASAAARTPEIANA